MRVLNEYDTHHYFDEFEKCQLFCPHCGKQEVWEEQSRWTRRRWEMNLLLEFVFIVVAVILGQIIHHALYCKDNHQ